MKTLLLLTLLFTSSLYAQIGSDRGHGGDGIIIEGRLYLLDLVEEGVEDRPYFNENLTLNAGIKQRVNQIFKDRISDRIINLTALKLTEIYKESKVASLSILGVMESLDFSFVNLALVNIHDEDSTLDYDIKDLIQLAVRRSKKVFIDKKNWDRLNEGNQTALLFHEVLYALAIQDSPRNPSPKVRELNGFLFSNKILISSHQLFINKMDPLEIDVEYENTPVKSDGNKIFYEPTVVFRNSAYIDEFKNYGEISVNSSSQAFDEAATLVDVKTVCRIAEERNMDEWTVVSYYRFGERTYFNTEGTYYSKDSVEVQKMTVKFKNRKDCQLKVLNLVNQVFTDMKQTVKEIWE